MLLVFLVSVQLIGMVGLYNALPDPSPAGKHDLPVLLVIGGVLCAGGVAFYHPTMRVQIAAVLVWGTLLLTLAAFGKMPYAWKDKPAAKYPLWIVAYTVGLAILASLGE